MRKNPLLDLIEPKATFISLIGVEFMIGVLEPLGYEQGEFVE